MKTVSTSERGQVLPLVAICLAVLMGFAGLAVDAGYWEYQQRQQQSATDAAALGGAQQLVTSATCPNSSAAVVAGKNDSSSNGFTDGVGNVTVTVNNPPASGPYSGTPCAVSATITSTHVASFFSRLFGQAQGATVVTQAVATVANTNNGCIYLLQQMPTLQLNGTNVNIPSCGILANSSLVQTNGGTINVGSFGYAHSLQTNGTSFPTATPAPMLPVADPCPAIAGCEALAAAPPAATGCQSFQNNSSTPVTINHGCYSLFQNNGGNVTMNPGLYVFTGVVQNNGGTISGSGVTMYVTAGAGPVQFNGSGANLSAPTSGTYANVLFYQVPSNTSVVQFNGGTQSLSGLVYAPGSLGQINGSGGQYVVLVFSNMQLNGGNTVDFGGPVAGGSIIKNAVLAQ